MSAFDAHQQTINDYLTWLSSGSGANGNASIPVPKFTWKGDDYSCNASFHQERYLTEGGYQILDLLTLEVLEPMPSVPQAEDWITFGERQFRLKMVDTSTGKAPKLTCYDPNLGA